jgi:hypothetical protein
MATYGYQTAGHPSDDPLVPDPAAGLGGWYDRIVGVLKRSWKSLLAIAAVTILAPTLVLLLLWAVVPSRHMTWEGGEWTVGAWVRGFSVVAFLVAIVVAIIAMYLSALGSAAAVWTITQQAAGRPASLGAALRFGRTRALAVWGWNVVSAILVTVGLCLCFVGSVYFAFATALITPIVVYERAPGVPRSFRLTHSHFGLALGRLALLGLVAFALSCCLGAPGSFTNTAGDGAVRLALYAVSSLWAALVALPVFILVMSGIVVTYAELRAREIRLSTEHLLGEVS